MFIEKAIINLATLNNKKIEKMHNPPHPGLIIRDDILPALGMTAAEAADHLGVTPVLLSSVISGKAAICPDMALRIERWLGIENGGSKTVWLSQQAAYDRWQARGLGSKN